MNCDLENSFLLVYLSGPLIITHGPRGAAPDDQGIVTRPTERGSVSLVMFISIPLFHESFAFLILFDENVNVFPVYAPLVRKTVHQTLTCLELRLEKIIGQLLSFNQSYGNLNFSPPPTQSPEEEDSSLYYCPPKVNLVDISVTQLY